MNRKIIIGLAFLFFISGAIAEEVRMTNAACSAFRPCNPGRFILGEGTQTYEFDCIDGYCAIVEIQTEECVQSSDCGGGNAVCINYKCEGASTLPDSPEVVKPRESEDYTPFFIIGGAILLGLILAAIIVRKKS